MSLAQLPKKARWLMALGALLFVVAGSAALGFGQAGAQDTKDWLAEGDRHFAEKSYLKASEAYEKVLKAEPAHAEVFRLKLRMGKCQSQLENYDKAEEIYLGLADDKSLAPLQTARANYHAGLFFAQRPHYYYENSKKERSWGRWIADSRYVDVSRKDAERSKDRLKASFDILEPEARKAASRTVSASNRNRCCRASKVLSGSRCSSSSRLCETWRYVAEVTTNRNSALRLQRIT